ncbi:hypothetical protein D9M71_704250 [compost metagenome]
MEAGSFPPKMTPFLFTSFAQTTMVLSIPYRRGLAVVDSSFRLSALMFRSSGSGMNASCSAPVLVLNAWTKPSLVPTNKDWSSVVHAVRLSSVNSLFTQP